MDKVDKYDYVVNASKLNPPVGKNKYTATVGLFRELNNGRYQDLKHDFGETKGVTASEAENKMYEIIGAWINARENPDKE